MKKFVSVMLSLMLMVPVVTGSVYAASPTPGRFMSSLSVIANSLESKHYRYGNGGPTDYRDMKSYSRSKYTGKAICADYINYALQRSGYLGRSKAMTFTENNLYGCPSKSRRTIIWFWKGTKSCHDCYKNKRMYGPVGEYPTLDYLISKKIMKKGDIIFQCDNPNNYYRGKKQTRNYGGGTQSHVEVYMGNGRNKVIYAVGAGATQHKYIRAAGVKKMVFSSYGIQHSQFDTRNRHDNPHVAYVLRLK